MASSSSTSPPAPSVSLYTAALMRELGQYEKDADVSVDAKGDRSIIVTTSTCIALIDVFVDDDGSIRMDGKLLFPPPVLKLGTSTTAATKLRCWRETDFTYVPSVDKGAKIRAVAALVRVGIRGTRLASKMLF